MAQSPAPCMNNSCSITTTQLNDGSVELTTNLNAAGGLECVDPDGVQLNLFVPSAPSVTPSNMREDTVRVSTTGEVYSRCANAPQIFEKNVDHTGIPSSGWSNDNLNFTITNPYDTQITCFLSGKFVLNYEVPTAGGYHGQITANVRMDAADLIEQQFHPSGTTTTLANNLVLKEFAHFNGWFTMNASQSVTFRTRAQHTSGDTSRQNNMLLATGNYGFRSEIFISAFPFTSRTFN